MSTAVFRPELMYVPLLLVDEPDIAMRETFDPSAMDELIESIQSHGVIEAVVLIRNGERFRIAAGHRRSIAAVAAGLELIPASVYPEGTPTEEALKNHENAFREEVNAAQEALYFERILNEQCDGDVMRLCGRVGRKQSYVEGRLDLLRGYPEVLAALREARITVSVARALNRYKDAGFMKSHLASAIETGAKATQVDRWRTDIERMVEQYPQPDDGGAPLPKGQPMEPPKMCCAVCGGSKDPYNLEFMYVHRGGPCADMLDRFLTRMAGGE